MLSILNSTLRGRCPIRILRVAAAVILAPCLVASGAVDAQSWPARPVKLVVAFAPGGPNDVMARILAQRLTINTGQQFIVENKPGAGGIIGTDAVAKSAPDGYTLLFASAPFTMSPALQSKMPYDTENDFIAVTKVAQSPMVLTVPPNSPHKTVRALLDFAKANPGKVTYGTGGIGSTPHLTTEVLALDAGVKLLHVPYKGGGQSIQALMAGEVDMLIDSITSGVSFMTSGRITPLAVVRDKRVAKLPAVPTFEEAGFPKFNVTHWVGIVAPRKVPQEVLNRLHAELVKALGSDDIKTRFGDIGAEPVGDSPAEFQTFIKGELQRWIGVVKAAKIDAQ
jgi:tripartite-type tricarboxylate transporter receptor subunit TctC